MDRESRLVLSSKGFFKDRNIQLAPLELWGGCYPYVSGSYDNISSTAPIKTMKVGTVMAMSFRQVPISYRRKWFVASDVPLIWLVSILLVVPRDIISSMLSELQTGEGRSTASLQMPAKLATYI
jgi:hypothetical protein